MAITGQQVAEAVQRVLRTLPGVRLALVFGSVARGQAGPRSDVDLAVRGDALDLADVAGRLEQALGTKVDVVELSAEMPLVLLQEIVRDGVCVFEATPGEHVRWRAPALWQLETDGPMLERAARVWLEQVAQRGLA
jgi:predicted nucleotidyltransferase